MNEQADQMALINNQFSYQSRVEMQVKDAQEKAAMFALGQMGFVDYDKNLRLCKARKNDVNQVINDLSQ